MALGQQTGSTPADVGPKNFDLTPATYTTLGTLLDPTKPDVRELYVETFGDQGITGFLDLVGAKKSAGTSDEVQWYEEGRLHRTIQFTHAVGTTANTPIAFTISKVDEDTAITIADQAVRVNDVILGANGDRYIVVTVSNTAATGTMVALDGGTFAAVAAAMQGNVIGNVYAQGTDQPGLFYETAITKRTNPFIITKETFHVNGSQATNIGWLKVNGQYRWYVKGEMDARKRFMNQREAMLMYSQLGAVSGIGGTIAGSEGYFAAIEDRGIVATTDNAKLDSIDDIDAIILLLDKQGAPNEYAMYLDRQSSLNMDDSLAKGASAAANLTAGLAAQFGAFNNSSDMAVSLGFKSFQRGGYTFHKHDWKMLNDPTVGASYGAIAAGAVSGALIPMSNVADARTGVKAPALEMNYKAANGYSRDIEHWVEGGGVLGYATNGEDVAKFHYRSESNLVTRAANQHVLLKRG
jgi:hypothetical protein